MDIWCTREEEILRALKPYLLNGEISLVLKRMGYDRSAEAVSRKSRRLALNHVTPNRTSRIVLPARVIPGPGDLVQSVREVTDRQVDVLGKVGGSSQTGRRPDLVRQADLAINELVEELEGISRIIPKVKYSPFVRSGKYTAVLAVGDVHMGRLVTGPTGRSTYDVEVAKRRIASIPEKARSLVKGATVDELVILLLGDMVDGEGIFTGQSDMASLPPFQQIITVLKPLWTMIEVLRRKLGVPAKVLAVPGNHGKTKGDSVLTNYDNILYYMMELTSTVGKNRMVEVISNRPHKWNSAEVKGSTILIRHKAPIQADTASARARFGGWEAIHHYDLMVYGHTHHFGVHTYNGKMIIRNGSIIGPDDYSEELAVHDTPSATIFLLSERSHTPRDINVIELE